MDKSSVLMDVGPDRVFWFNNGASVRNIYELLKEIRTINDNDFKYHSNDNHDDFANWIGGVLHDIELSEKLRNIRDRNRYAEIIESRIKQLERKTTSRNLRKIFLETLTLIFKDYAQLIIVIILILISIIFTTAVYFGYNSIKDIRLLNDKITYLEQRNSCFNNYFNDQILKTQELIDKNNNTFNADEQCIFNFTASVYELNLFENTPETIHIKNVSLTEDEALIYLKNATLAVFGDTSSMIPALNHNTKALEIKPESSNDLNMGDVIAFKSGTDIIVHRIIDSGYDELGYYAITKGDNNQLVDPNKVRFKDIQGKIVVLIY